MSPKTYERTTGKLFLASPRLRDTHTADFNANKKRVIDPIVGRGLDTGSIKRTIDVTVPLYQLNNKHLTPSNKPKKSEDLFPPESLLNSARGKFSLSKKHNPKLV